MEDWDKFRAVLVDRIEPAQQRRQRMARAGSILLVVATLMLVAMLFLLVHERMPALVLDGAAEAPSASLTAGCALPKGPG